MHFQLSQSLGQGIIHIHTSAGTQDKNISVYLSLLCLHFLPVGGEHCSQVLCSIVSVYFDYSVSC